jgi:mannose-6-phosphate isomerase-like protein (cupin superfamily)
MRTASIRSIVGFVAIGVMSAGAAAQQPPPSRGQAQAAAKTFASSADVAALAAKAKADRKPGQANVVQPLMRLPPYSVNLESRVASANAAVHEKEAEMFYVVDGAGTLVTGGKLTGETRTNADNLSGTGIEGGTTQHVAKGDFVFVPENTPHQFTAVEGTLLLMSVHVPRTADAAR